MSFYKSDKFKRLQSEWYEKLKEEGFDDIEEVGKGRDLLKKWDSSYFQTKHHPESFKLKEAYYQKASIFLEEYFSDPNGLETVVWRMHCEGKSLRMISKELSLKTWEVHHIVKNVAKLMLDKK